MTTTSGKLDRPHWLCVAYAFAPINRSGTLRTLGFVKHLDALGWDATVLTVEPRDEPLDEALLAEVPDSTTILRTRWYNLIGSIKQLCGLQSSSSDRANKFGTDSGAADYLRAASQFNDAMHGGWGSLGADRSFRDWISRLLMTPDSRVGWIGPAIRKGMSSIRRRRPAVIYSTSPYMSSHLISWALSRWARIPWVADFRDPWRGNPFRELGYPSLDFWDSALERTMLRAAAHVVCNTPTMTDNLSQRLPFVASKCSTILNGFDADQFEDVRPRRMAPDDHFVLAHFGEFYGPRSPRVWFEALRRVLQRSPKEVGRLHLAMLGSEYYNGRHLGELAKEFGVADHVEVPGHHGHVDSLSYMAGSDALILAGPAGAGSELQVPNKLFEYLAIRRPILAAVSPDSPTVPILREAGAVSRVCGPNDAGGIADAVSELIASRHQEAGNDWQGVEQFERARRAEELAEIFDQVSGVRVNLSTTRSQRRSFQQAIRRNENRPYRFTKASAPSSQPVLPDATLSEESHEPVSVITTVVDDCAGLEAALESLHEQSRLPDEIIIVSATIDITVMKRLRELVGRYPRARMIEDDRCNIAQGRNRAIREASHDLIACIDAGCVASRAWLRNIVAPFSDPAVDVVGGTYTVDSRSVFERLVGLLTMPGALKPLDPVRYNPSARSMALRRSAWERAGGFPEWLQTAEDTLFDLKLRSLDPSPGYTLAEDAAVAWRPRKGPKQVFKQFQGYARGEAHIGRGVSDQRYRSRRYLALTVWATAAAVAIAGGGKLLSLVCVLVTCLLFVVPHLKWARAAASRMSRFGSFPAALVLREWVMLAQWWGHRKGHRERESSPGIYVERLREYLGRDAVDGEVPGWSVKSAPLPRTLIVAWHWAPTTRASANVMAALFQNAPTESFRVITRHLPTPPSDAQTPCPPIPTDYVDWPLPDDRPVRLWTWLADMITVIKMIRRAKAVDREWGVQRVLAVFPHRFSLVAGWLIARQLSVPFVAYMHDLCSEALITRVWIKRAFWRVIDRKALKEAWMVIVPTKEFAEHYGRRGIRNLWVLPHCLPTAVSSSRSDSIGRPLRLIYSGNVYEPHEDAIEAVLKATRDLQDVRFVFQSNPHPLLSGQCVQWMPRRQAMQALHEADVFMVALGAKTPYPDEIHCCFPSKITDYLAVGRPILAVVPEGCFVDRFIRQTGCGIVVNRFDRASIREAIDQLRSQEVRKRMSAAARQVAAQIQPDRWLSQLLERLMLGPGKDPASPAFPDPTALHSKTIPVARAKEVEVRETVMS